MKILIDKLVKFDLHKIDKIRKFAYHTTEQTAKLPVNRYTDRTHTCGELSTKDVGMRIKLMGRVQYARYNNKIIKLIDRTGNIQCIVDKHLLTKSFRKTPIYNESFVQIEGVVKERSEDQKRKSSHESSTASDDIEVAVDLINVLSQAREDLPILNRSNYNTSPDTQLKYRYLHLRNQEMQQALRFRSEVCKLLRIKLWSLEFIEVETPTLSNRTPGGANEFIVPTQSENLFYSLVQSPQQYKQLLMIADSDRYFQICRCYRDETARSDRQPEFTQVDMELSCTSQDLVMKLMEDLIYDLLCNITKELPDSNDLTSSFDGNRRLKRLTYHNAFQNYGTDKPDTRFGWLIESTTDKGLSLKIPHIIDETIGRILIKEAISTLYSSFLPEEISYNVNLHLNQSQISIQHDSEEALKVLGRIRILLAQELETRGVKIYNREFEFIWVTDFPLFTDKVGNLEPNHHPFTAPTEETKHLLESEPLKVIGQHYDLVLNGQEVAGGSIRIHDAGLQRQIFSIMGVDEKIFDYFLEALSSGCPPHGGIAIGLDRLISILLHRASIKDVIAFPKANSGRDLMTGCPQELSAEVRRLYHMK